jgi:hypothetical protein
MILNKKTVQGWTTAMNRLNSARAASLLSTSCAPPVFVTAAIAAGHPFDDLRTASGTEFMMLHSVRCALPFFLVVYGLIDGHSLAEFAL